MLVERRAAARRRLTFSVLGAAVAAVMVIPGVAQGAPSPTLTWTPTTTSYDFGTLSAGTTASQTFTLTNTGKSASGAIKAVEVSGSTAFTITSDTCTGTSLGPRTTCSVTVEYAPTTAGESDAAELAVTAVHASTSITLSGMAASLPVLSLSPGTLLGVTSNVSDFSFFTYNLTMPQQFTVSNSGGTANLTVQYSGVSVSNDACTGTDLTQGGTCTFTVAGAWTTASQSYSTGNVQVLVTGHATFGIALTIHGGSFHTTGSTTGA